jgi:hypothetical protein
MTHKLVLIALFTFFVGCSPFSQTAHAGICEANCSAIADKCEKNCTNNICWGKCDQAEQSCLASCDKCGSAYKACIKDAILDEQKVACRNAYLKCKDR